MPLRTLAALTCAVTTLGLAAAPATAATSVPLGAHETFGGTVNGATEHATIRMACFGPDRPGRTGHPMAGQTVGVFVPEVLTRPTFGRTGDPARSIVVWITTGRGTVGPPVARFRRLWLTRPVISASQPLPTALTLPCSGSATAVFAPVPATGGAAAATVDVTLSPQP
jgi:hypothetical protein